MKRNKKRSLILLFCIISIIAAYFSLVRITAYKICKDCGVFDESNNTITNCNVYTKNNNNSNKEFLVLFKNNKIIKLITIDIKGQLIGINDSGNGLFYIGDIILLNNSSITYTPVNDGYEKIINHYKFGKNQVEFETFGELKGIGETIKIHY